MYRKERKAENVHKGHRLRLKRRFQTEGVDNLPDHVVMELLLFFAIPQGDTNEIAHHLIHTFGSLHAVFDASIEDLQRVKGIGEHAATLIKLFPAVNRKILESAKGKTQKVAGYEQAVPLLEPLLFGLPVEKIAALFLDNSGNVIWRGILVEGTVNGAHLDLRIFMEALMRHHAAAVVLAHNHPRGVAAPSTDDVEMTRSLLYDLKKVNIELQDHLIFAGGLVYSFRGSKAYQKWFPNAALPAKS